MIVASFFVLVILPTRCYLGKVPYPQTHPMNWRGDRLTLVHGGGWSGKCVGICVMCKNTEYIPSVPLWARSTTKGRYDIRAFPFKRHNFIDAPTTTEISQMNRSRLLCETNLILN